jgi:hypothetical protein
MKIIGTVGRMWADSTYSSFTDSLVEMLQFSERNLCSESEMILYNKATISWHSGARNQLVEEMEGDWLLQVDTDHVFAPDMLVRLLELKEKYDYPVISAIYQYKHPPHGPVAGIWQGDKSLSPILDWDRSAEVIPVGAVGAGALLVDRKVFAKIKRATGEPPFEVTEGLSEDYSFCRRCRILGIPIGLAVNVQCHHTIRTVLDMEDYVPGPEAVKVGVDCTGSPIGPDAILET